MGILTGTILTGSVLLFAFLMLGARRVSALSFLFRLQSIALAALSLAPAMTTGDGRLLGLVPAVLIICAYYIPRTIPDEAAGRKPFVSGAAAMLLGALAAAVAAVLSQKFFGGPAAAASLSVFFLGFVLFGVRKDRGGQAFGVLLCFNGLLAMMFSVWPSVPPYFVLVFLLEMAGFAYIASRPASPASV
jgi:hydrogenase-4 membrane subunit HyfE